jgi:hypothetical protein
MRFVVKPRLLLGPRWGSMKAVAAALAELPPPAVLAAYREGSLSRWCRGQASRWPARG